MEKEEIERELEQEAKEELKHILSEDALGYIHALEEIKKRKLKERGIEVFNSSKKHPGILVD